MEAPPKQFKDLATIQDGPEHANLNAIGVVVDVLHPTLTSKQTWMLTFRLLDLQLYQDIIQREGRYIQGQGLAVRFFKQSPDDLPKVRNIGDIVLIRNIAKKPYNAHPLLLGQYMTTSVIFPGVSIPAKNFEIAYSGSHRLECIGAPKDKEAVSVEEQRYVISLKNEMNTVVQLPSEPPGGYGGTQQGGDSNIASTSGTKRPGEGNPSNAPKRVRDSTMGPKFRLVEDLRHFEFADLCVQVVKIFPHNYGCDLYVTDYTENREMFRYASPGAAGNDTERDGDTFGYAGPQKRAWPGPYGQLVLKVNMKDPHALYIARNVSENDFVQLRNVKMKKMAGGSTLEGDMWPDSWHPDRVNVQRVTSFQRPEMAAMVDRKEDYWKQREKVKEAGPKMTETEKRKKKKQRREEEKAAKEAKLRDARTSGTNAKIDDKTNINPHVRCNHAEVGVCSVREINDPTDLYHTFKSAEGNAYKLPFVNVKQRAKVRCVDFMPMDMRDFAVPAEPDDAESDVSTGQDLTQSSQKYRWSFSLLLEDAQSTTRNFAVSSDERVWVRLGHEEAQYLLGNAMPDPRNLRRDKRLLAQLRERMYILWGNLAEKKGSDGADSENQAVLSNRPFECCLAEYGEPVEDDSESVSGGGPVKEQWGWRKCHRMFGVTIL